MSFFDRIAPRYDRTFAPDAKSTAHDLAPLLDDVTPGERALDLGCGTGRAFPVLVSAGLLVLALDASSPMLALAARRSSAANVARVRADLYARWPIRASSIDRIFALHAVLAHPPIDESVAMKHVGAEIRRVARPGARVAIDLPEPAWARANLRALGDDRYAYEDEIEAWIPEPAKVLALLDLPLVLSPCATGVRATGRLVTK